MLLFDLPIEIVSEILVCAVLARGVKRALRLRLVCKRFSQHIQSASLVSRLLDSYSKMGFLFDWYIENDHGASKFWHSYLVYRVQKSVKPPQRRYSDIHQVAERVCVETGADMEATVEALCWPALREGINPSSDSTLEKEPPNPRLELLCAAAYLNLIPLAKQLLQEGYSPHSECHLFSSPMRLAAWAGNALMLEIFQVHVPEMEGLDLTPAFNRNWRGKVGPDSIIGAARRGDIDMVRLAVYPPSRAAPDSTDFAGEAFGRVKRATSTGNPLSVAQYATRDVEVYKYLNSFFAKPNSLSSSLARHARLGNLDMVRYLLDAGVDTRGIESRSGNPLVEACRECHENIVDLLLKRGADPNFSGNEDRVGGGSPILAAAQSGSLIILRKLIDHGAESKRKNMGVDLGIRALSAAVRLEHTNMVKFLVASGFNSVPYNFITHRSASANGSDSMFGLLQGMGVTIS